MIDVNDNAPVFVQSSYSASINMVNPVGAPVLTVSATDRDQVISPVTLSLLWAAAQAHPAPFSRHAAPHVAESESGLTTSSENWKLGVLLALP